MILCHLTVLAGSLPAYVACQRASLQQPPADGEPQAWSTPLESPALAPIPTPTPELQLPAPVPLPDELRERLRGVTSFSGAIRLLPELRFHHLVPRLHTIPELGIRQIVYELPEEVAQNLYLNLALGQPLPTRFQERLPPGVVAVVTHFPRDTIGVMGPFIWVQAGGVARQLYEVDVKTAYRALGYPDILLAEIYIEAPLGYPGPGPRLPFHPWDRVRGYVGEDLARGNIPPGTVYVWAGPDGSWRLWEYPDIPPEGDLARLIWHFHPRDPESGKRQFEIPIFLQQSQEREQEKTFSNPQRLQDNVGPSIIIRTDEVTGLTDVLAVAPYLYLQNPDLLRDILYNTPLPDGSLPNPDHLIIGAGDLHYSSNGKMGLLLTMEQEGMDMSLEEAPEGPIDFWQVKNHIGLYVGKRKG